MLMISKGIRKQMHGCYVKYFVNKQNQNNERNVNAYQFKNMHYISGN